MASRLRSVNWVDVWEQCQEGRRQEGRVWKRAKSERIQTPPPPEQQDVPPSSYHQLTPTKKAPREEKIRDSDRKTVTRQGKDKSKGAQECLQNKPRNKDRREPKKEEEWRESRDEGEAASATSAEPNTAAITTTTTTERVGVDQYVHRVISSIGGEAEKASDYHVSGREEEEGKNGSEDAKKESETKAEDVKVEFPEAASATPSPSEDEPVAERKAAESILPLTSDEEDRRGSEERETTDKFTQVTFCDVHKTFLALNSNDAGGAEGNGVKSDDDGCAGKRNDVGGAGAHGGKRNDVDGAGADGGKRNDVGGAGADGGKRNIGGAGADGEKRNDVGGAGTDGGKRNDVDGTGADGGKSGDHGTKSKAPPPKRTVKQRMALLAVSLGNSILLKKKSGAASH